MSVQSHTPTARGASHWVGWGLSGLAIAFLVMDAVMKLLALPGVLKVSAELGFQGEPIVRELGLILLLSTVLYAAPPPAVLRAVLLTGYLCAPPPSHFPLAHPLFPPPL